MGVAGAGVEFGVDGDVEGGLREGGDDERDMAVIGADGVGKRKHTASTLSKFI